MTIVAQVMFTIYRNAINNTITELNVSANLGTAMFSFSWTATLAALLAFFGFLGFAVEQEGDETLRREKSMMQFYLHVIKLLS
jgi:hypothetical protein